MRQQQSNRDHLRKNPFIGTGVFVVVEECQSSLPTPEIAQWALSFSSQEREKKLLGNKMGDIEKIGGKYAGV